MYETENINNAFFVCNIAKIKLIGRIEACKTIPPKKKNLQNVSFHLMIYIHTYNGYHYFRALYINKIALKAEVKRSVDSTKLSKALFRFKLDVSK